MRYLKSLKNLLQQFPSKKDRYEEFTMNSYKSPVALHRKLAQRRWKIDGFVKPDSLEYVYCWVRR
jgi:hypothetical protein